GRYLVFEGARTKLPQDVAPGETVTVDSALEGPPRAGAYYLQWDLVQENVTWFSYKSGASATLSRHVVGEYATAAQHNRPRSAKMPQPVSVKEALESDSTTVSRMALWRVAFRMFRAHPITGVGPDGFRNLYGRYAGISDWNKNIYTNNTYIEIFTNLGILGGLAFLWLVGLACCRAA